MDDFTSGSNVEFQDHGGFGIGMECFFQEPNGNPTVVNRKYKTPPMSSMTVWNGSFAMRPRDPSVTWGTLKYAKAEVLCRITIDKKLVFNMILKSSIEPVNLPIAPFTVTWPDSAEREMIVEFQQAGAGVPVNAELELCGCIN